MAGQPKVTKPSRSDEVLDADQQLRISYQIRAQFDSSAPKRPTKPNRSEPDLTTTDNPSTPVSTTHQNIPEFDKLRSLQSQSYYREQIWCQMNLWRHTTTESCFLLTSSTTRYGFSRYNWTFLVRFLSDMYVCD
ncbi:uncharacterized protein LOC116109381 [Pistacia vera]|uniref:uncharacterized protein LOC116109381 n=1 Tax=Pistacia vera TaxID=55513 RepID=UPI0012633BD0|nr:uncharacterized protein LOC116109381 [Pistacia vera]